MLRARSDIKQEYFFTSFADFLSFDLFIATSPFVGREIIEAAVRPYESAQTNSNPAHILRVVEKFSTVRCSYALRLEVKRKGQG